MLCCGLWNCECPWVKVFSSVALVLKFLYTFGFMYCHHKLSCTLNSTLLRLYWHALLTVFSAKCRRWCPEWTILSHIDCFIQEEVVECQVLLNSLQLCYTRMFHWYYPIVRGGERCEDLPGICFVWPSAYELFSFCSRVTSWVWYDTNFRYFWFLCHNWIYGEFRTYGRMFHFLFICISGTNRVKCNYHDHERTVYNKHVGP